jgi:curved DNA-binding protein CbpA
MDYYQILDVTRFADLDEIRKAFRKKAMQFHPDINNDPRAKIEFLKINEAYQVLQDDEKRKLYDLRLVNGFPPQVVYYRPAQTRYRAYGDKYAHYRSQREARKVYRRADKLFDYALLLTLLFLGSFSLLYGIYRLWIEEAEFIDPYPGIIMGSVFIGILAIVWFNRHKFREE